MFLIYCKYLLIQGKAKLFLAPSHVRQRLHIGAFLLNIYVHVNKSQTPNIYELIIKCEAELTPRKTDRKEINSDQK